MPNTTRQYRVDHGLCPICENEAAPYYLCPRHRQVNSIRRLMNKAVRLGAVEKSRDAHGNLYKATADCRQRWDEGKWGTYLFDMKEGDKRLRPRLGRRPVDFDEMLMAIFREAARPLSEDEIVLAWGKLRSKRKTESLAGDVTKLVLAQRRRDARLAKRAIQAKAAI